MEMIKYQEMVIQRHFAISYSLYSCLIFPSRGSIQWKRKIKKKDILIRKLPHNRMPPQLNKVTLCWTLRWHSLFMCLMNWILKGQTAHMLHSGRNQSMFKNSDKRLSRVSERCKIYTYALFEFGQQIIAMLVLHHAAIWTPSEEKYLTVSWF